MLSRYQPKKRLWCGILASISAKVQKWSSVRRPTIGKEIGIGTFLVRLADHLSRLVAY